MEVFRCLFTSLIVVFNRILCKETSAIWLRHERTDVTYGTSTPIEGAQLKFQCLLKCNASEGCESVNVNQDNFQCELSPHHPTESGLTVNQRPGWTVYYRDIRSCKDRMDAGDTTTGFKTIIPDGISPVRALCVMDEDDGGWTVIQKRESATDFYNNWTAYRNGFGDDTNFWLGLENIHRLTAKELFRDLESLDSTFQNFSVENETMLYKLSVGNYSFDPAFHDPGESFLRQNGMNFSTYDNDNDAYPGYNCAVERKGGYWYNDCFDNNLNGLYGSTARSQGINWKTWTGYLESLKYSRMMIRPEN